MEGLHLGEVPQEVAQVAVEVQAEVAAAAAKAVAVVVLLIQETVGLQILDLVGHQILAIHLAHPEIQIVDKVAVVTLAQGHHLELIKQTKHLGIQTKIIKQLLLVTLVLLHLHSHYLCT